MILARYEACRQSCNDEKHDHTDLPHTMLHAGINFKLWGTLLLYLQYKTKIKEQLCSGEGKCMRSSQIL